MKDNAQIANDSKRGGRVNYTPGIRATPTPFQERFERLADKWERETKILSSPRTIMSHPDYEAILQMGDAVIPLILARMKVRPWFWFKALKQLSGEANDPVTPSMRGDLCAMTEAWLEWGAKRAGSI